MTANVNPFFCGRLEFEKNPIVFVPDRMLDWAGEKPIRFEGQRGSGKSSMLMSLTWAVAWKVSPITIVGSRTIDAFWEKPQHVGVCARVEEMDVALWDKWDVSPDVRQRYFGTYLEFLYLNLLLDALEGIRRKNKELLTDPKAENQLVRCLLPECFSETSRPTLLQNTFSSLRSVVADVERGIRQLVFNRIPESVILKTYQVVGPGALVRRFGDAFRQSYPELSEWTFLLLLDDCDLLTKWQTMVVNTAVAGCRQPIAYKLASLSGRYPTFDTLDEDRPLMVDVIEPVHLPCKSPYGPDGSHSERDTDYLDFVNGVCRARIEKHYGKKDAAAFDFKRCLGPFNLEQLLEQKLTTSENDDAYELLKLARQDADEGKTAPITRTWLSQKKVRDESPNPSDDEALKKRRDRQLSSQYLRKWNHVAAVAICKEFDLEFPYCGYTTVLHLTGDSIREMLRLMAKIWDEAKRDIEGFVNAAPLKPAIQARGIVNASKERLRIVSQKPISQAGASLSDVCGRLGSLFSECQSYPYICTTAETAAIKVRTSSIADGVEDVLRIAVFTGTFFVKTDGSHTCIGLHPILAPQFKMSFRLPFYYPEPITHGQLHKLFLGSKADAKDAQEDILRARLQRHEGKPADSGQATLFDMDPE